MKPQKKYVDSHHAEVNENHKTGGRRKAPGFMRKQQRFSLHCLPGCGTIAVLRQGGTTMKTTAMTAEERVRYMTQAPVRRLILEMSAPTVISMFANSALIGFGQGFQPVCGTNYGAGKRTRVRQAFYFCIRLGCGAVAALSVLAFAFAPQLIQLFRDDADVVIIGTAALRAQCLTLVLTVWIILCTMLLQTIGMAWQASVVAAARQGLFLIPVVFILPNLLGLAGVEYAQPAADLLAFALALPMGLSVLKTFRSDAPTPAHTLREE